MPNYYQIGPVVFDKKIFKDFFLSAWNFKSLNNFERGPSKDHFSVKFGEIPHSSLGRSVV